MRPTGGPTNNIFELLPIVLLALVLYVAVARPFGWPEAATAIPGALAVVALGSVSLHEAATQLRELYPVVVFLAAILVVSERCRAEGLFDAAGSHLGAAARGRPRRLLTSTFVVASATTAILSLDATVVLLTPVVILAARRNRLDPRPAAFASGHLSNSASLLLPVSNLTNLLAFSATGLTFGGFATRMALPMLFAVVGEYAAFRIWFRHQLASVTETLTTEAPLRFPRFASFVIVTMLVAFGIASILHIEPVWVALAAAGVMAVKALLQRQTSTVEIVRSVNVGFCLFVLALGVIVAAVSAGPIGHFVDGVTPSGDGFVTLLVIATIAALASNVLNNIPATLLMLAVVGPGDATEILAVLVGVNIGPNLTYVGSLATLLWRKAMQRDGVAVSAIRFSAFGLLSVTLSLSAAILGLWLTSGH